MTINYDISSVPTVKGATAGGSVYILLEQNEQDGVWRYKDASIEKPKSGTFIRGDIKSVYGSTMRVEYGIETYFFERNASIPWENITIEVMVSSNGGARILQLLQNGEPMEITYVDFPVYT